MSGPGGASHQGWVNSGADLPVRQQTARMAQVVRTVRPSFVVTVFVGINGGPFRGTGWPGWGAWAIPTTIRQYKLLVRSRQDSEEYR